MATIVTSGSWSSTTTTSVSGLDTHEIKWGDAESGYVFEGGSVEAKLDGTEFTLGRFTHHNHPVSPLPQQEFDCELEVRVRSEEGLDGSFRFRFHHNETSGSGTNPPDLVDLPTFISEETITVDGEQYKVMLSGFKQDGEIVRQFVSPEEHSNTADIVALFTKLPAKPDVAITHVEYEGTAPHQADEYVEILNRGTEPADLSGWSLGADDSGQDFDFPAGTTLEPGHRIRVYTNEEHPESGGLSYGIGRPIWNNKGDVARLHDGDGKSVSSFPYGDKVK